MNQDYLNEMGIQTWSAVCRLPGARYVSVVDTFQVLGAAGDVGVVSLDRRAVSERDQVKAWGLLDAMLLAIGLRRGAVVEGGDHAPCTLVLNARPEPLSFPHPETLLSEPTMKREAWGALRVAS